MAGDSKLELSEMEDVSLVEGRSLDALAIHERPVGAVEVAEHELLTFAVDLRVAFGNGVEGQRQIEANDPSDAERHVHNRKPLERGAPVDQALQAPLGQPSFARLNL